MIRRKRGAAEANMLSTPITVLFSEYTASDGIIDTNNDDVNTGDQVYVDVDEAAVGHLGLSVTAVFS